MHVVRDWRPAPDAVSESVVRAPLAMPVAGVPLAADRREVAGGLTPTYSLGEASALK